MIVEYLLVKLILKNIGYPVWKIKEVYSILTSIKNFRFSYLLLGISKGSCPLAKSFGADASNKNSFHRCISQC